MFLTFQDQYEMAQDLTSDDSSASLTTFKREINIGTGLILARIGKYPYEYTRTVTSVADQQAYELPIRTVKVVGVTYTTGGVPYVVTELKSREDWLRLNETTGDTGTFPDFYYIEDGQIKFYPTPDSSGDTITLTVEERFREMTRSDYSTGNVSALTNGDTTVTGNGTTWNDASNVRAGDFLKVDSDGDWYEIDSITDATTIELKKSYQGTTISGSEAYTIGEQALKEYEDLHVAPVYWALSQYYSMKEDSTKRAEYLQLWQNAYTLAEQNYANRTGNNVIPKGQVVRFPYGRSNSPGNVGPIT